MLYSSACSVLYSRYVATVNIPKDMAMLYRGRNVETLLAVECNIFLVNQKLGQPGATLYSGRLTHSLLIVDTLTWNN